MQSPSEQPISVKWVSKNIIRQAFNKGKFWERAQTGELIPRIKRDKHPHEPPTGEPPCTRKQFLVYYTPTGEPIAWVHQFLRPDKTLGASGNPDPKRLILGDTILAIRSQRQRRR